jgi:hypothetical protein
MLPDDFRRLVALDALRTGIPVRDDALKVEHKNRVIDDPLDQKPEAPLAFKKISRLPERRKSLPSHYDPAMAPGITPSNDLRR